MNGEGRHWVFRMTWGGFQRGKGECPVEGVVKVLILIFGVVETTDLKIE